YRGPKISSKACQPLDSPPLPKMSNVQYYNVSIQGISQRHNTLGANRSLMGSNSKGAMERLHNKQ
ncbi:MAG: hypothetical protein IJA58_08900, partial [Lachnospiraceae bacterium]|nr:hypothetical protein [Lachnospiraceae bacterium]